MDTEKRGVGNEIVRANVTMKPTCPECGSNWIVEWNNTKTRYPITEVVSGGPVGGVAVSDYGVADVLWDTSEVEVDEDPFQCRDCSHSFGSFDHMVEESPRNDPRYVNDCDTEGVVLCASWGELAMGGWTDDDEGAFRDAVIDLLKEDLLPDGSSTLAEIKEGLEIWKLVERAGD